MGGFGRAYRALLGAFRVTRGLLGCLGGTFKRLVKAFYGVFRLRSRVSLCSRSEFVVHNFLQMVTEGRVGVFRSQIRSRGL